MNDIAKEHTWTRLDYLALALSFLAVVLFVGLGMQLAGLATLICAFMAWTRPFDENRKKGKPALGAKGRMAVAAIMGTIAVLLFATHDEGASRMSEVTSPVSTSSFGSSDAFIACQEGVETRISHPSSLDMAAFTADFNEDADGRSTLNTTFTAKNSFNLESEFQVRCIFEHGTLVNVSISER